MNMAKTLKRKLGNRKPFFRVAWDTEDILELVGINGGLKGGDIDWRRVEKYVFKLQKLIYRASSRGEICKMRKYQRLLTKSYYARLLAVRRATEDNQGKNTAGVDGVKFLLPMERLSLVNLLKSFDLKASLPPSVWILKPGKDEKPLLGVLTIYDRAFQVLVRLGMEPEWEARFKLNGYGFFGRSIGDAIETIFDSIKYKPKFVLDADISGSMIGVDYDTLLGKIGQSPYRQLIKQWLKFGVFDNQQFPSLLSSWEGMGEGVSQGGVISSLLTAIALYGMEERLNQFARTIDLKNEKGYQESWQVKVKSFSFIRYADGFVILHENLKVVLEAKAVMEEWLNQIGLELKPERTKMAHTLEEYEGNKPGFDFLGFAIRQWKVKRAKEGFKTLIQPSSKCIKTHYRKLADICDFHKNASTKALIAKLNPVIRGWANYYSTVASKGVFHTIDNCLWKRIWRWASRRHPNKSAKWVKKKYFPNVKGSRSLVFNNGEYILNRHSDVSIISDIRVKGNKSFYDGEWIYWSDRVGKHPGVRKEVTRLLTGEKNKCAFCRLTQDLPEGYSIFRANEVQDE